MRILLVEDDDLIGYGIEAGLRQAGFTVDWARDGHKAGLALDTTAYALVLLDLGLPRVPGMELLKRLRDGRQGRAGAGADRPRGTVVDRVGQASEAGADDYPGQALRSDLS